MTLLPGATFLHINEADTSSITSNKHDNEKKSKHFDGELMRSPVLLRVSNSYCCFYIPGLSHSTSQMWPTPSLVSSGSEASSIHRIQCSITDSLDDRICHGSTLARLHMVCDWSI